MILIIDNYDSFTYNLVDLVERYVPVKVYRNDQIDLSAIEQLNPEGILLSPGPGKPLDGKISVDIVKELGSQYSILGVCLGHQIIGEVFGANVIRAEKPMHGKTDLIEHDGNNLFHELMNPLRVMRYHSLLIDPSSVPGSLEISAQTSEGEIMGIRHKSLDIKGVQFHPESILSDEGDHMVNYCLNTSCSRL